MAVSCHQIAVQSKGRLAAISDGIFGVAMTLMLLARPERKPYVLAGKTFQIT